MKSKVQCESLISIIVPVYKVENYLERCLISIIRQSYQNLEIILVDDGSPDDCPLLCDAWAEKDKRIRVIHKANGSLSDARNVGIDASHGDYLMFVDSDDYISLEMCQKLMNTAIIEDADIVSCNLYWTYGDGTRRREQMSVFDAPRVWTGKEMLYHYYVQGSTDLCVVWNKLYKRALFFNEEKKIRFPHGRMHEDNAVNYLLYYEADRIAVIPDALYFYVQRNGSIMQQYNDKNMADIILCAKEWKAWAADKEKKLQELMDFAILNTFLALVMRTFSDAHLDKQIVQDFQAWISQNITVKGNQYISRRMRVKWHLAVLGILQPVMQIWDKVKFIVRKK